MALPHLNRRMLELYQIVPNVNCPQNWHFRLIDVNQHSGGKCIKHSVNKPWTNFASDFVPRVQPDQPFERPHGEADSQQRSLKEQEVNISDCLVASFIMIQGVFFNWASPENVTRLAPPIKPSTGPPLNLLRMRITKHLDFFRSLGGASLGLHRFFF